MNNTVATDINLNNDNDFKIEDSIDKDNVIDSTLDIINKDDESNNLDVDNITSFSINDVVENTLDIKIENVFAPSDEWITKYRDITIDNLLKQLSKYKQNNNINKALLLGDIININDGTKLYRNTDFKSFHMIMGDNECPYDSNMLFKVFSIIVRYNDVKEETFSIKFNNNKQKIEINNEALNKFIKTNNGNIEKFEVRLVNNKGEVINYNDTGLWLDTKNMNISNRGGL